MSKKRIAIVVSQFNPSIGLGLLKGTIQTLKEHRIPVDPRNIFHAPGAFEVPFFAKRLALSKKFDGIICLGAVVKGETAHFEFISLAASMGIQQAMLETMIPMSFGILTTYTGEQARRRSNMDSHNKGREAALALIESLRFLSPTPRKK